MKVSDNIRQGIKQHKKENPENSSRFIATLYGVHHKTVNRILREVPKETPIAYVSTANKRKIKILFLDIETFPNIAYVWGKYQQDVIEFVKESCIACFAAKWLGEPTFAKSLPDYPGYKPNSYDDFYLIQDLWNLLDEADIIVAHNGDAFDLKIIKSRFLVYNIAPPSPFKTVDTKKVAKNIARFNSNKLNDLSRLFGEDQKIHTSFALWKGCIEGDLESWRKMVEYNKKDVDILEPTYLRLRPYMSNHPNHGIYEEAIECPKCGSTNLHSRGYTRSATRIYQKLQCQDCGGWSRSVRSEKGLGAEVTNL